MKTPCLDQCRALRPLLFIFAFIIGLDAQAISLTRLELVPDGSFDPPGDRITCEMFCSWRDAEMVLEVRPFIVGAGSGGSAIPVKARAGSNTNAQGDVLIRANVVPSKLPGFATNAIIVPYAAMAVAVGSNTIAYEIRCVNPSNEVEFAAPTRVTTVQVTEAIGLRNSTNTTTATVPVTGKVTRDLHTVKTGRRWFGVGNLLGMGNVATITSQRIEVPINEVMAVSVTQTERVTVFGEFRRAEVAPVAKLVALDDPLAEERVHYANRPWKPVRDILLSFATTRNQTGQFGLSQFPFGNDLGTNITYGTCLIDIPAEQYHKRGKIEEAAHHWWDILNQPDPNKYFGVGAIQRLEEKQFIQSLSASLTTGTNDLLLFVHGYNNSFEFAALRAAQVTYDIQFPGRPVLFSWPSSGTLEDYLHDERMAEASWKSLATILSSFVNERENAAPQVRGKIHVIAHSMGNRVFLKAIRSIQGKIVNKEKPFGHVILAAADIDLAEFVNDAPATFATADSVSLYFCGRDKALLASHIVHGEKRAGEAVLCLPPLENIDAEKADTSWLSHGYFSETDLLLIDLQMLICQNLSPDRRPTLRSMTPEGACSYWRFP